MGIGDGKPRYERILLKISGEALMGEKPFGLDMDMVGRVASEIAQVWREGVQSAWSSAVATFFAVFPMRRAAWNAPAPISWGCWRR